ncbi:uncharacterized protein PG986_006535 [Apiospora aurea]|uniref:Uncharacterized protein n=1 Tax=Apiospora aurea TaxID=335848 RepID=A0ABR1QL20_9PEZI
MGWGHLAGDPSTVVGYIENENSTPVRDDAFLARGSYVSDAFKQIEAQCGKGAPGTIGQKGTGLVVGFLPKTVGRDCNDPHCRDKLWLGPTQC